MNARWPKDTSSKEGRYAAKVTRMEYLQSLKGEITTGQSTFFNIYLYFLALIYIFNINLHFLISIYIIYINFSLALMFCNNLKYWDRLD